MSSYTVSIYINDGDIHRHALTKEIPTEESAKNYATFRFEDGSFYPFKTIHSVKVFEFVGRTDGTEILHLGTPHTS